MKTPSRFALLKNSTAAHNGESDLLDLLPHFQSFKVTSMKPHFNATESM